jgi:hypothetical protein
MEKISHDELLHILRYEKDTGLFFWNTPRPKIRVGQQAGYLHHKGYINLEINGKHYTAHRLAWFYCTGNWPKDQIDHINCNKSDNRIENLREATNGQNHANTKSKNKLGFKGIGFKPKLKNKPYTAKIRHNKKNIHIGCYATPEEAFEAYKIMAKKLHGEFARF